MGGPITPRLVASERSSDGNGDADPYGFADLRVGEEGTDQVEAPWRAIVVCLSPFMGKDTVRSKFDLRVIGGELEGHGVSLSGLHGPGEELRGGQPEIPASGFGDFPTLHHGTDEDADDERECGLSRDPESGARHGFALQSGGISSVLV